MAIPEVAKHPVVINIISKYAMMTKFGSSYTFESLEEMDYLDFQYVQVCMNAEAKAAEHKRTVLQNKGARK